MIRNNHPKFASTAAVLLGAALLLAGCGNSTTPAQSPAATSAASSSAGGDGYGAPAPSATASSPAAATTDLKTASTSLGNIVVDAKGMTLYYFTKDAKDTTTSACTGECLAAWPIATTTNATPTVEGVTGKVGTITSPDGAKQLTLNGMPLYYYAADSKPGDVKGQGVKDVWYVASPSGEMIK
jgi:predicted lipoprotein with Yx(FWY)xxD motif